MIEAGSPFYSEYLSFPVDDDAGENPFLTYPSPVSSSVNTPQGIVRTVAASSFKTPGFLDQFIPTPFLSGDMLDTVCPADLSPARSSPDHHPCTASLLRSPLGNNGMGIGSHSTLLSGPSWQVTTKSSSDASAVLGEPSENISKPCQSPSIAEDHSLISLRRSIKRSNPPSDDKIAERRQERRRGCKNSSRGGSTICDSDSSDEESLYTPSPTFIKLPRLVTPPPKRRRKSYKPEKRDPVARQEQNRRAQQIYRDQVKNLAKAHADFAVAVMALLEVKADSAREDQMHRLKEAHLARAQEVYPSQFPALLDQIEIAKKSMATDEKRNK